ncbi:MAG: fasciclin domain-containing protein [Bacteroides sp.]|nr:fasciclin domain-containing protein [Bacteroides sp.]
MKNREVILRIYVTRIILLFSGITWMYLTSCKDELEDTLYRTSDDQTIVEYLENEENGLTDFLALAERAKCRGMLQAYGTYTCFVPTNEALQRYFRENALTLETISQEDAQALVGIHVVNDTLTTADFVDGRLPTATIRKQYLTTATKAEQGEVYIEVNRQARIIQKDMLLTNGYIHVVDNMLEEATKTIAETIRELPDVEFSIMKELLEDTGFYEVLEEQKDSLWYTYFL